MNKLPYDIVYSVADEYIIRAAKSKQLYWYWWDVYHAYIGACGWTDKEIDQETLRKVDANWEPFLN